jgi:hypothetical protein
MWVLCKQTLVGGATVDDFYSETSQAHVNSNLSEAKKFESEEQAIIFRDAHSLRGWAAVHYASPEDTRSRKW